MVKEDDDCNNFMNIDVSMKLPPSIIDHSSVLCLSVSHPSPVIPPLRCDFEDVFSTATSLSKKNPSDSERVSRPPQLIN
jgi:hypothetical protein